MVFEPDVVPASHAEFLDWYAGQTKWGEDHGYDDPALSSVNLRAWFEEMIQIFPPMNGPVGQRAARGGGSIEFRLRHWRRFYSGIVRLVRGGGGLHDRGAPRREAPFGTVQREFLGRRGVATSEGR